MNLEITCPACNFSKTVLTDTIPVGASWVICPVCKYRFELVNPDSASGHSEEAPWESRSELGLWRAIYQTFVSVLFTPSVFFRKMTAAKGVAEPMAFGLLLGSLGFMFGFFWNFLLVSGAIVSFTSSYLEKIPLIWVFIFVLILSPLLVLMDMFIKAGVIHVLMLAFKDGKKGFGGTFRTVAYGQSTRVLSLIPFIGGVVGWFWNFIIVIVGLREMHKTSHFKAAAAVFAFIILKCLVLLPIFLLKFFVDALGIMQ
jgi:rubredoxin